MSGKQTLFAVVWLVAIGLASGGANAPFHGGDFEVSTVAATEEALEADLRERLSDHYQPFGLQMNQDKVMVLYVRMEHPWYRNYSTIWVPDNDLRRRMGVLLNAAVPGIVPIGFSMQWGLVLLAQLSAEAPVSYDPAAEARMGVVYGESLDQLKANLQKNTTPHTLPLGLELFGGSSLVLGLPTTGQVVADWKLREYPNPEELDLDPQYVPVGAQVQDGTLFVLEVRLQ